MKHIVNLVLAASLTFGSGCQPEKPATSLTCTDDPNKSGVVQDNVLKIGSEAIWKELKLFNINTSDLDLITILEKTKLECFPKVLGWMETNYDFFESVLQNPDNMYNLIESITFLSLSVEERIKILSYYFPEVANINEVYSIILSENHIPLGLDTAPEIELQKLGSAIFHYIQLVTKNASLPLDLLTLLKVVWED